MIVKAKGMKYCDDKLQQKLSFLLLVWFVCSCFDRFGLFAWISLTALSRTFYVDHGRVQYYIL